MISEDFNNTSENIYSSILGAAQYARNALFGMVPADIRRLPYWKEEYRGQQE